MCQADDRDMSGQFDGFNPLKQEAGSFLPCETTTHISVDHREEPSGMIALLEARGVITDVRCLPTGDYIVNGFAVIERKTAQDFLVSIIDGRLFAQAARLRREFDHPLLLIEGDPLGTLHEFDPRAIKGALISISAIWRIPVLYSASIEETAEMLVTLGRQERSYASYLSLRKGYLPKKRKTRQLYVLQGLPFVGPRTAVRLLEHFGSVGKVMNASKEELVHVKGIGERTAEKIRDIIESPYA